MYPTGIIVPIIKAIPRYTSWFYIAALGFMILISKYAGNILVIMLFMVAKVWDQ